MGTTAEKLTYLSETKTSIKNAIVAKGVEVPEGTTFREYADLISGISTGLSDADLARANATPEDVTAGKTFYAGNKELKTGIAEMVESGLVLKQAYTGTIQQGSPATFNINSKTFLIVGSHDYGAAFRAIFIYYLNGSRVAAHYNNEVAATVSETSSGFNVTILPGASVPRLTYAGPSAGNTGFTPLYIFEG